MAMSYDEVLNVWGRKLLIDRGYTVSNDARIDVEIELEKGYGCDTCAYDEAVVVISVLSGNRNERCSVRIESYKFREILLELVKIAAES